MAGKVQKVLIVDDAATIRSQLTSVLTRDFECITAANGHEGLSLALSHKPDAIVLDLEMPQLDGVGFLRTLRSDQRTASIPVVIVTTVTDVERVNECRILGCAGFVLKPVTGDYLLAKLRQLIRVHTKTSITGR